MAPEVIIPGGTELLAADAALALLLTQQRDGDAAQHPQVLPGCPVLEVVVVLAEQNVQYPVQTVLDAPVPPRCAAQLLRTTWAAADVVRHVHTFHSTHPPDALHANDGLQVHPLASPAQPVQDIEHHAHPLLRPAMTARLAQPQVVLEALEVGREGRLEAGDD